VLSFLGRMFIDANASNIAATQLESALDDELFALNQRLGQERFPRRARDYLEYWATPERGWLRRFYPSGSDEPHYDVTPAVEKAIAWVSDLRARSFIGTESRLNTIFDLLRQLVDGADADPAERLADLERRRNQIDAKIARVTAGRVDLADPVTQRDRYQQFAQIARELLGDFRQVEENFRSLDRQLREQIAGWAGSKGELLDDVVANRKGIADSDQGRSFRAFYDLLLSAERQAELSDLLTRLHAIDTLPDRDPRLERVHFDWMLASERTQATVRCSPSSSGASWTTRSGWRTDGSSTFCEASKQERSGSVTTPTQLSRPRSTASGFPWCSPRSGRCTGAPRRWRWTVVRSRPTWRRSTARACSSSSTSTATPCSGPS
jgi:hypothetical protein